MLIPFFIKNKMNITNIYINKEAVSIKIQAELTDDTKVFDRLLLWDINTFKHYDLAIDLSDKLPTNTHIIDIDITINDLELETIEGLYFIELRSNEDVVEDNSNFGFGLVANYTKYQVYLIDKLLSIEIPKCKDKSSSCEECNSYDNLVLINMLFSSLQSATQMGYYDEAIKIIKTIDELIEICHDCPNYEDTLLRNGFGFGMLNNDIVVI